MPVFGSAHFDMNPKVRELLEYDNPGNRSLANLAQTIQDFGIGIIDYYIEEPDKIYFDLQYQPEIRIVRLFLAMECNMPNGYNFQVRWFGME